MDNIKGLLLFDYDGTLVDGSIGIHDISETTINALNQARENGYLTILASGRSIGMVESMKHLFDGFITTNGAYAKLLDTEYYDNKISTDTIRRIYEFFQGKEDKIYANIETQTYAYVTKLGSQLYEQFMEYFGLDRSIFRPWEGQIDDGFYKISVMYNDLDTYYELENLFKGDLEIIHHPHEYFTEMTPKGCTKGAGLEAILQKSGFPRDKVYAFGDSANDYTMLKAAGHAIIMGRHMDIVEEVAEFTTKNVEDDGIVYAMKHYGIIE